MQAYDKAVKLIGTEYFQEYCYSKIPVRGFGGRGVGIAKLAICEQSGIKQLSELLTDELAQERFNNFADKYEKWVLDNPYMTVTYREYTTITIR